MSEQRERFRKSLAEELRKTIEAEGLSSFDERCELVAHRIDLLIESVVLDYMRNEHRSQVTVNGDA